MTTTKEVRVSFRGIDKTREAFGRIKQNFRKLQDQLGKVRLGFGKIGNAIAGAFSARVLKKIIDNGAEIGRLANKLDISTNSLSELKYAAESSGVEFSTLTSGLAQMNMRISDAAGNFGEAKDALRLLGLSAQELNQIAPNEQIEKIAEALSRVGDVSDRTQLAIKLFGSEGAALLPILDLGEDGIKRFREEAQKLGVSLSREECDAMAKFNQELDKLQTVMSSLITSVLIPILPMITAFFEAIRSGNPLIKFIIIAVATLLAFKLAAWFIAASTAVAGFTVALLANPIGLVAVGISVAVAALVSLTSWFGKSTNSATEFNQTLEKTRSLATTITIPKGATQTFAKHNELKNDAKRIFEQTRTPLEKYNAEMEKLNRLLKQGLIDQETYNRAAKQNRQSMGIIGNDTDDVFSLIEDRSKDAADSLIDNFSNAAFGAGNKMKSLKETCSDIFRDIQSDILKMSLRDGLAGASGGGILGGLSGLFGGGGGSSGGGGMSGLGSMFAGFFANGGKAKAGKAHVVGDGGEPELFIPQTGGQIIPFSKLSNEGNGGSNVIVNMNIQTPDLVSFNHSQGQIAADIARQLHRANRNL